MKFYVLLFSITATVWTSRVEIDMTPHMKMNATSTACANKFDWSQDHWRSRCRGDPKIMCELISDTKFDVDGIREITVKIRASAFNGSHHLLLYQHKYLNNVEKLQGYFDQISLGEGSKTTELQVQVEKMIYYSLEIRYLTFCGRIDKISFIYYTCRKSKRKFIEYPKTFAPKRGKSLDIKGRCTNGARQTSSSMLAICESDGTLKEYSNCSCPQGYTLGGEMCTRCLKGYHKDKAGEHACTACGENSLPDDQQKQCLCQFNSFRAHLQHKNYSAPCYSPQLTDVKFSAVDDNSAVMSWQQMGIADGVAETVFILICDNCRQGEGNFPIRSLQSKVTMNGLLAKKHYLLSLKAEYRQNDEFVAKRVKYCDFETTNKKKNNQLLIIILGVTVPIILISIIIIVYLYLKQKRTSIMFLRRINSLKRLRRPPPPPDRADSTASEINPYSLFRKPSVEGGLVAPSKIPELLTDDETIGTSERIENKYSILFDLPPHKQTLPQYEMKPVQQQINYTPVMGRDNRNLVLDEDSDYVAMNAPTMMPSNKLFNGRLRSKTFCNEKSAVRGTKCKSEFIPKTDSKFEIKLSVHDINKAKMSKNYKRISLKDNHVYNVPRLHHSADDINKLYDVLVEG